MLLQLLQFQRRRFAALATITTVGRKEKPTTVQKCCPEKKDNGKMPGKKNRSTLLHVFPKGVREENQEKLAKNLGSCWVADLPPLK